MRKTTVERPPLLVAEAGVPYLPPSQDDAIQAWLDLMETVEALCPHWPLPQPAVHAEYRL